MKSQHIPPNSQNHCHSHHQSHRTNKVFIGLVVAFFCGLNLIRLEGTVTSQQQQQHQQEENLLTVESFESKSQSNITSNMIVKVPFTETVENHVTSTSNIRFFFIMALEGTGHHVVYKIALASPLGQPLQQYKIYPQYMRRLAYSMFDMKEGGMFNLQCATNIGSGHKVHSRDQRDRTDVVVQDDDMNVRINKVAQLLKEIETKLINGASANNTTKTNYTIPSQQQQQQQQHTVTVPINGLVNGMSYPNNEGPCRTQNYPNLDLLYRACDVANIDCFHLLMYRNPYSILKSTFYKRRFNPTILGAIHMYSNMLQVIWTQLLTHPTRTEGCLGFFNGENETTTNHWKERVQHLFGWNQEGDDTGTLAFESFIEKVVANHSETWTSSSEREYLVPSKYNESMATFLRLQNNVVSLCYQQYEQNRLNKR